MVTKVKEDRTKLKGIDLAYVKAIENIYNREEQDIDRMIASSKRVGAAKPAEVKARAARKRLTETEIINQLIDKSGMKRTQAREFFTALATLAASEVTKNGEFTLPGFGKLVKATRTARQGRNPATGKLIKIPAKTTVKFRLGKAMKDSFGK